jgi:hypothetical protein
MHNIKPQKFDRELKKRGAELLVLSLKALAAQRSVWEFFVAAINRVTRPGNA